LRVADRERQALAPGVEPAETVAWKEKMLSPAVTSPLV
jgi:hypothetical protein